MLFKLILAAVSIGTIVETTPSLQANKAVFFHSLICQNEEPARFILQAWLDYGEIGRDIMIAHATSTKGVKIPALSDCTVYEGAMTPIRNISRWENLRESREITGYISISLVEVEIYPDYVAHRVFAFLTEDILE